MSLNHSYLSACCSGLLVIAGIAGGSQGVLAKSGPVHVNRVSVVALMAVSGIGRKKAEAIVAYREAHGPFHALKDMERVKGLSKRFLAKHRDDFLFKG